LFVHAEYEEPYYESERPEERGECNVEEETVSERGIEEAQPTRARDD
jgi:hypothetical protein